MASHKSAEKRALQSVKRNQRNKSYLSKVKTLSKSLLTALTTSDAKKASAEELDKKFREVQSVLQKAAGKGVLQKNKVARRISRLQLALKKTLGN